MKKYSLTELREMYLRFFESKGHLRMDSFSLVPENDKALLLINAGMAPLKSYFTGEQVPPRKRITTCQKCVRTLDIENVGKTARHGTFFEMLGNFSFGDYFKEDAIPWAWEFLTKVLEIPEDRLYITIYKDDEEAHDIWRKIGVPEERIFRMGKEDNFWEIGSGPCGPDSEIHFDRGEKYGCGKPTCGFGCDCDRFIEIWNIVFTQFDGDGNGNYTRLAHPNIDTGMGLERLAVVMQDVDNLFEVDTVRNIILDLCKVANTNYDTAPEKQRISVRVITDHIRTATFLISDGVLPSNEGRGYILRRVLRRAARHGRLLGIKGNFLDELCETVIRENGKAYPNLIERHDFIKSTIAAEEARFAQTLDSGLAILEKMISDLGNSKVLTGEDVFKLYDTFGFPIDLTREIAEERGLTIDEDGFKALMQEQRKKAREARAALGDFGWTTDNTLIDKNIKTKFLGYTTLSAEANIIYMIKDDELQSVLTGESKAAVILDETPFYGESGGQIGDIGVIKTATGTFTVTDTKKNANGQFIHYGYMSDGEISLGKATAIVDEATRRATMRNHSSVHLLQASLRSILGTHVEQAGSYVDPHRARFDFTHTMPLTSEQLKEVEIAVNNAIMKSMPVTCAEMPIEEARKTGAMALFGEKYGDIVRVVKMGDYSTEFCGGTHVSNTADIGLFKIVSETSVAAGVRRIEAITGLNVYDALCADETTLHAVADTIKANNVSEVEARSAQVMEELKAAKKALEAANTELALAKVGEALEEAEKVGDVRIVRATFAGVPVDALRLAIDKVLDKNPDCVVVFATVVDGKVLFAAGCGKDALAHKANAGKILSAISPIVGGGGGGRPDRASSGGKDASKISEALSAVTETVKTQIG